MHVSTVTNRTSMRIKLTNFSFLYDTYGKIPFLFSVVNKRFVFADRVDRNGNVYNNDFLLTWKGPWQRSDYDKRYPDNAREDTKAAAVLGCDATVFMIFNNYTGVDATDGHEIGGYAEGGCCEAADGRGFTAVVDQGKYVRR